MVVHRWQDDIPPDGGTVGNFFWRTPLGAAARAVRDRLCQLWTDYPEFTESMVSRIPRANILSPVLPLICRVPPTPPPTTPPLPGGQCCAEYTFETVQTDAAVNGGRSTVTQWRRFGKLSPIELNIISQDANFTFGNAKMRVGGACPGTTASEIVVGSWQYRRPEPTFRIQNIRRVDGRADDCGAFPITRPPVIPPANRLNFNIDVNVGGVNVSVPVSFNIASPSIGFNIKPEFNIQVGGINMIFDIEGISFNFDNTAASPVLPLPDPRPPQSRPPVFYPPVVPPYTFPPLPPNRQPGGGGGASVDLQPVLDAIKNVDDDLFLVGENVVKLLDCDRCDRPPVGECRKQLVGTGRAAVFQLANDVEWVGVEITSTPRIRDGYLVDGSPDVLLCGWHEFGGAGRSGVRTPIQYDLNVYPKLEGATSFSFAVKVGYIASYFVYLKPEEEEEQS